MGAFVEVIGLVECAYHAVLNRILPPAFYSGESGFTFSKGMTIVRANKERGHATPSLANRSTIMRTSLVRTPTSSPLHPHSAVVATPRKATG